MKEKNYLRKFDALSFWVLTSLHVFFAFALFASGVYLQYPIFVLIAIFILIVHILLHFIPYIDDLLKTRRARKAQELIIENSKKVKSILDEKLK